MAKKTFYVTTAVDYVNAHPHVGHAFEKVLADALARYKRLQGFDVFFLTGVDENAQKNVEAAQKAGVPVKEFIDKNAALFIELCKKLDISYNDFIRTTAKEHAVVVQKIIKKLIDNGDIYKNTYKGLYCLGCETYYTEKDLINGKCPEHNIEPELREEEAYFFKLSKYKNELLKILPKYIVPSGKAKEIISRLKNEELNDICISRKGAKWGIDFPNDKDYKIWVWIDALINYISGLKDKEKKYWPADVHVVGKGINWFHSVIWIAVLLSAKYSLPKKLLVHGYLNIGGKKISKSLGNIINPLELLEKYPSDAIRYSLLKCSTFEDSDYSEEIIIERNNNELADKLGNLVSRVSTLAEKFGLEKTAKNPLKSKDLQKAVEKHFEKLEFDKALNEIFTFIDKCNEYVQKSKPWESGDKEVLYNISQAIRDVSILLSPFIPQTAEKISKTFNFEINYKLIGKPLKIAKIKKSEILFRKIETINMTKQTHTQKSDTKNVSAKTQSIKSLPVTNMSSKSPVTNVSHPQEIIPGTVQFSDWERLDLIVAKVKSVEDIEGADKLYKLTLDVGELGQRTVCAGLKQHYKKEELKGKKLIYFSNLSPRLMRGIESQGMILAAVNKDHSKVVLIAPEKDIDTGARVS